MQPTRGARPLVGALAGALLLLLTMTTPANAGLLPPILGGGSSTTPPPAVPDALASFTSTPETADEAIDLTWQYATSGPAADGVKIRLFTVHDDGSQSEVNSGVAPRGLLPDSYRIAVPPGRWSVSAEPVNGAGSGPRAQGPVVTVANSCATADICATVGTTAQPAVSLAGEGFLYGLVDDQWQSPLPSLVTPLRPKQWRFAFANSDTVARQYGVSRTEVLSDLWTNATAPSNGGYARTPWSDWTRWTTFVTNTVLTARAQGWTPDYWDIWNEPNGTCCPKFSPSDQTTMTVDRWLRTYETAWHAIKAADPTAKVVAPSVSVMRYYPDASASEFDLGTFLQFSASHGLVWDAISWHEIGGLELRPDVTSSLQNVDRHVAIVESLMADYPGTVAGDTIFVNEYGNPATHMLAGWSVGWFRALEDTGVAQANRSCVATWECVSATLDGLVTSLNQPTAAWWAYRAYADLADAPRAPVASTSSWQLDGLASRDTANRTVRVLLGRHWSCNPSVNPWCNENLGVTTASVDAIIDWPYGSGPVQVTSTFLPAGTAAVATPLSITRTLTPANGELTVPFSAVQDGSALSIVAQG